MSFSAFAPEPIRRSPALAASSPFVAAVLFFASLAGCEDKGKVSAQHASADVATLSALCEKDVGEVDRGLPEGAKRLTTLYSNNQNPADDLPAVRRGLAKIRRDVADLAVAKSTFLALADIHGLGIRNDLDEDTMAGRNLAEGFPEILKAVTGAYVHTTGAFPGIVAKPGPDKDWIAATAVKKPDGSTGGILVTGWSYRYFARHLAETLKSRLIDAAKAAGVSGDRIPVLYVALYDESGVYSAPLTPDVNDQALKDANLLAHTKTGAYQGVVTLTGRDFGYAAVLIPQMGPNIGIVVLRSEL